MSRDLDAARADLVEGLRLLGSAESRLMRANLAPPLDESRTGRMHWTKLLLWIDTQRFGGNPQPKESAT